MRRMLSHAGARRFYDRLGARQDSQWWYEDPATAELVAHADFGSARAVFELGCGTGRFAEALLRERLPAGARYEAVDLSATMVRLARERLSGFGERARVRQSDGRPDFDAASGGFDRFVANYVLDLLDEDDIRAVVTEAARLLCPGGLLCLAGLGRGTGPLSRTLAATWSLVHRLRPAAVGGCRPLSVARFLDPSVWDLRHCETVVARGIPSEVVVAARRIGPGGGSPS